jgi:hypothetical protein
MHPLDYLWSAGRKIAATTVWAALDFILDDATSEFEHVRSRLYLLRARLLTDAFALFAAALVAGYLVARSPGVAPAIERWLTRP